MTVGSLFAGIGGFDLGFRRAGFDIEWQVELDEWCRKVLARHFPDAKRYGDIRETGSHNLSTVDVICGGFPCQPFSSAGKRGGAEDDRYLWPEMLRVISELRPSWVVAENVDELTFDSMAAVFDDILSGMESIGYEVQPFIIPAAGVDADHERYRLWILGNANRNSKPACTKHDEAPRMQATVKTDPKSEWWGECGWIELEGGGNKTRYLHIWAPEPGVDRVSDGVPYRMDRIRGLGNAVVPQIPELIGRLIMEVEYGRQE